MNNKKEGLLYKKIREKAEEIADEDVESGAVLYLPEYLKILDEAKQDFPKVHKNFWDERGHLVTYEETVLKWREKWFGGVSESE